MAHQPAKKINDDRAKYAKLGYLSIWNKCENAVFKAECGIPCNWGDFEDDIERMAYAEYRKLKGIYIPDKKKLEAMGVKFVPQLNLFMPRIKGDA